MLEKDIQIPFRETIKEAPEFSQHLEVDTIIGKQKWPLEKLKEDNPKHKVVFLAKSIPSEIAPTRIKISYEAPYGLKARKQIVESRRYENDFQMEAAQIKYQIDDLEISYNFTLKSPIVTTMDHKDFVASIYVTKIGDNSIPPIARVDYDPEAKVQISTYFPNAEYEKMLTGDVEKREKEMFRQPSYSETYLQWEYLVGGKVGVSRYDHPEFPDDLWSYRWLTNINAKEPRPIGGTPYQGKITRSLRDNMMTARRLRFSRINKETGQSIMISVPDSIERYRFYNDIQHDDLTSFFMEHPVVFCVKNRQEERKWYSTGRKTDKE